VPLAIHLKSYYKLNKKFGGRDRKHINHFCYCYYRTGRVFKKDTIADAITKSLFLCTNIENPLLQQLNEAYHSKVGLSFLEKIAYLQIENKERIFPLLNELSESIDKDKFIENQLRQPNLYIRIRPKYLSNVLLTLQKIEVVYKIIDPYTIQLPNGFKVEEHFIIDKEVVIQDYASQMVLDSLIEKMIAKHSYKVWDCCAASGGKSILISDLYNGSVDLFVTDIRATILENLEKRFALAKIKNYKIAEVNLYKKPLDTKDSFDIIICDAPCSGSGTWSRTPEQVSYTKIKKVEEYTTTQKNIALNAIQSLKENGLFVYITCSVFAMENEKVVAHLLEKTSLQLINSTIINGYTYKSDSMFVALFTKPPIQF
jgi:16S rRNA (cytosine967-C5)-methyltransferase